MDEVLDEIVQEFLVESYENLDQLDRDLVTLEQHPNDIETLSNVFRTVHTIKGTCGFLGFSKLESVSHVGESLLSRLRDGELVLDPDITSTLLAMVDAIREILASIESTGQEEEYDYSSLIEALTAVQDVAQEAGVQKPPVPKPAAKKASKKVSKINPVIDGGTPLEPLKAQIAGPPEAVEHPVTEAVISEVLVEAEAEHLAPDGRGTRTSVVDTTIRVDVSLLDKLMDLVGELVLARNQVVQLADTKDDPGFNTTSQRLNLVTTELQEGVMKTRLQPIGNLWQKLPRVIRDVAAACDKQVRLDLEGSETELDKSIIEAIADPLTHLVRNAIDHGIESPDDRTAKGKPKMGVLSMRAFHEGGQVNIEIADDGAGIDTEALKARALERSLITPEQATRMQESDLLHLIFLPGFSTADKVTNLSGRGVGMDVVKTNIEAIGGTVDIQSVVGRGTTFKVKIPLTLAIIPALVVLCRGERYAIPQVNLLELVRVDGTERGVEMIHGTPVYRLRDKLLPLVYLDQELRLDTESSDGAGNVNIVVLQADEKQFGLVVDSIADTQEIVVKPLGRQLKQTPVFAGATILGDGRVALILDVLGLGQRARVISGRAEHELIEQLAVEETLRERSEQLLVFAINDDSRMAIPLGMVARLEEFLPESIEWSNDREVVQYRDDILPLIRLADLLPNVEHAQTDSKDKLQVIVHSAPSGRSAGLVVSRIVDIAETILDLDPRARARGIMGSTVIQGHVTDILDTGEIIEAALPRFYEERVGA